ncbi:MAG: dTDP-4-dehydrorhamnose 3,5-epimerase [Candidatus Hydrogenedentes bacterium ADurb.Bin101]|nr:MAG: dTDP-4-dehydrorhamnose 3,5-epimerase [Candidatus Hydrogenedentes bacterium ADurb.Bin101]
MGFAHGFVALRDNTRVYYKCTGVYQGEAERAIRHDDPDLNITWPIPVEIISEKDANAPLFKDSEHNFT